MNAINLAGLLFQGSPYLAERALRSRLAAQGLNVKLTDSCLRDFASHAREIAQRADSTRRNSQERLAEAIERCCAFIRDWTTSDSDGLEHRYGAAFVTLAHKHALPRAWSVPMPAAREARRPTPTYLRWASVES